MYLTLLICLLTVPGFALINIGNISNNKFLLSVALSYSLFCLSFIIARYYSVTADTYLNFLLICVLLSVILIIVNRKRLSIVREELYPLAIIIVLSYLYHLYAGPYTEIPADIYAHIERFQFSLNAVEKNTLGYSLPWLNLLQQGGYVWYFLLSLISKLTATHVTEVVYTTTLLTKTIFALSVYYFSYAVFRHHKKIAIVGLLAVLYSTFHLGINIFSFWRYYSFAPVILNFSIFYCACALFINLIEHPLKTHNIISITTIAALAIAASTVHMQETLFILVTCSILVLFTPLYYFQQTTTTNHTQSERLAMIGVFCAVVTSWIICFYLLQKHIDLPSVRSKKLWQLSTELPLLSNAYILNLKYQFSQVLTLWGALVYLLFFFHWQRYRNNALVLALMISPILTVANPYFVDLFLRLSSDQMLWRLSFLIPIHYVAADLSVYYFNKLVNASRTQTKLVATSILIAFVALLLPINNTWQGIHFSRLPSISPVDSARSYHHLSDLIGFLSEIKERRQILTDPVTGYIVSAMTHHHSNRRKFFRSPSYKNFSFNSYDDDPLAKFKDHLIVINQRYKGKSASGQLSKHWPASIFEQINHYYPTELFRHLESNSEQFRKLWENDNVLIYEIL